MKKVFAYIIRFTAILLSVIFLTLTGVDAAIAGNNVEVEAVQVQQPILKASDSKAIPSREPETVIEQNPLIQKSRNKCQLFRIPHYCDMNNPRIQEAYRRYLFAVYKCRNGQGTPQQVIIAWNNFRGECRRNLEIPKMIKNPPDIRQNPVAP